MVPPPRLKTPLLSGEKPEPQTAAAYEAALAAWAGPATPNTAAAAVTVPITASALVREPRLVNFMILPSVNGGYPQWSGPGYVHPAVLTRAENPFSAMQSAGLRTPTHGIRTIPHTP